MILKRFSSKRNEVLGTLKAGNAIYFTLEPIDNLLPAGKYNCEIYDRPNGTKAIRLWNDKIRKYRYFLIHVGNSVKDTMGCILVGNSCDLVKRTIGNSKKAMDQLLKNFDKELIIGDV